MLCNTKCSIKISGWNYKKFWLLDSIIYVDGDGRDPRLGSGPGWFRSKNGNLVRITPPELTEYKGKQPLTWGFYEAYAEADIPDPKKYPECCVGHAVVTLEARDFSWQKPSEFGIKIRELRPDSEDPFPGRPFECYLLDEDASHDLDQRREQNLEELVNGSTGIVPDGYLHFTVTLDSCVHYTRDIPFTPVNEMSEVEAIMKGQLQSVVRADGQRLNCYFSLGRSPMTFHEVRNIFG